MADIAGAFFPLNTSLGTASFNAGGVYTGGGGGPVTTQKFDMVGYNGSTTVAWTVTGAPDYTGAQYTGGGTLDLATVRVAAQWTE